MQKQQKAKDNKNTRNKSTNAPSNTGKPPVPVSNTAIMNKSVNGVQKSDTPGQIKLPKVNPIGSSSVSNSSMKAIWEGGPKKINQ